MYIWSFPINVKNIFCLKLPKSSRKPIKKFLHVKMLTLQNVIFEKSEYSNTFNETVLQFKELLFQILVHTKQK